MQTHCLSYSAWKIVSPATGVTKQRIVGYMVFALVSYVRPCKSTLANFSLSYYTFMLGVLVFGMDYWGDLSVNTEALDLTFIIISLLSHTFVFFWIVYIVCWHIRISISLCHFRIMILSVMRDCFCLKNHIGYRELPDSDSVGNR